MRLGGGIGQMLLLVGAAVKLLHIESINPMGLDGRFATLKQSSAHQPSATHSENGEAKREVQRMHCMHVCESSKGHAQIRDITSALRPA